MSQRGDVNLPAERVDTAVLVDVYRYVILQEDTKDSFVASLFKAMKPGGVVVVVHVKSSHMQDEGQRLEIRATTIADFVKHGFIPGRRVEIQDERWPREVLEFQRPAN